jgi:hypothetical protein
MELADIWSVMKWVLLVLLAGFVGQFGKTFAQRVMMRFRKEPQPPATAREAPGGELPAALQSDVRPSGNLTAAGPAENPAVREAAASPILPDKKLLKTLAKQKKKETKALNKAGKA